ncbi:beta-galactosidase domain 4-containing protein [Pontibacter silvestris]|nr:beta-galactosidase domain 4-containing protein [Pontibacter silvestris]MCC9139003.1 DUF4981 domain-containing protein [Pontibacter silvestris]
MAQTKDIKASLMEHGQIVVPFNNEEEALTFNPLASTLVQELVWSKEVQQVRSKYPSVFSTTVEMPPQWLQKEKLLVLYAPKAAFTVEVNGHKLELAAPGVNTKINLTSLIPAKSDSVTIKVISDREVKSIDNLVYKALLFAVPNVHAASTHLRIDKKYPNLYRSLNWMYFIDLKNHSPSATYKSNFHTAEKVRDDKGEVVYTFDKDYISNNNEIPAEGHWRFYFFNHPDVYSNKWTAETPYLYTVNVLVSSTRDNASVVVSDRVGVRTTEVKEGQLRINNVGVHFKPAAYIHPPLDAPVPTKDSLREFIRNVKQHSVNTLLVYGLPANNDLYSLADEYGLYIVQYMYPMQPPDSKKESYDDLWLRQRLSMIYQIRNHPSVVAWATDGNLSISKEHASALKDSLLVLDSDRPFLENAVVNLPTAAQGFEQLTGENLIKLKKAYQPVKIQVSKDSKASISNLLDFAVLDNVLLKWKLLDGDKVLREGEVNDLSIEPGGFRLIKLPFSFDSLKDKAYTISFEIVSKEDTSWADKGHVLAWECFDASTLKVSHR